MNKRFSVSLRLKCFLVSALAFVAAAAVFVFLYNHATPWVLNRLDDHPYLERHAQRLTDSFQQYVTDNGLTAEEAIRDTDWAHSHRSVHLFLLDTYYEIDSSAYFESDVRCSDGTLYAYITLRTSHYDNIGAAVSLALAALVFFLTMMPFVFRLARRVTHLSQEMDILAGGQLDYSVQSPGTDELAQLGQSIESMRLSVLEQMARESRAVSANNQLVTSLSHDLRTPLTKLTGYLEILRYKRCSDPADAERYMTRAIENAVLLKELTDQLFQSALVTGDTTPEEPSPDDACSTPLSDILSALCFDLHTAGFKVNSPVVDIDVHAPEVDLRRIFDNLFSNIRKYADPAVPVAIYYKRRPKTTAIMLANGKKENAEAESSGVGLRTVYQLMEENGGTFEVLENDRRFVALLIFPIAEESAE